MDPPPIIKGWGDFPKIGSLGMVPKLFLERGDKLEKVELVWKWGVRGGLPLFLLLYSSIIFTLCVEKVKFPLLLFRFSAFELVMQVFIVLKHYIIWIFLIHSGSVQIMLTALFISVWNTQKTTWTNFFKHHGKMFLILKRFWWR